MKKKIQSLNVFQKIILVVTIAVAVIFSAIYAWRFCRPGFEYSGTLLMPSKAENGTVYSGEVNGMHVEFTLSDDKTVICTCDDKTYGPYTLEEDPEAASEGTDGLDDVVLYRGDTAIFRGVVGQDGSICEYVDSDSNWYSENTDAREPDPQSVLNLIYGRNLTNRVSTSIWILWIGGLLLCAWGVICIFFADEIYRFDLSFRVAHPENAEPSDWEMASQNLSPIIAIIIAIFLFSLAFRS